MPCDNVGSKILTWYTYKSNQLERPWAFQQMYTHVALTTNRTYLFNCFFILLINESMYSPYITTHLQSKYLCDKECHVEN